MRVSVPSSLGGFEEGCSSTTTTSSTRSFSPLFIGGLRGSADHHSQRQRYDVSVPSSLGGFEEGLSKHAKQGRLFGCQGAKCRQVWILPERRGELPKNRPGAAGGYSTSLQKRRYSHSSHLFRLGVGSGIRSSAIIERIAASASRKRRRSSVVISTTSTSSRSTE